MLSAAVMKTKLLIVSLAALAGCGGQVDSSDDPELLAAVDGKADSLSSTSTYYTMRPDLRKCASPLCGGFFLQRVNRTTTRCVDGTLQSSCRVLGVDYSALGFTDAELASFQGSAIILRGTIKPTTVLGNTYGELAVSEVWKPATETAPSGTVYRVSGHHEAKLDSTLSHGVTSVDLSGSDATAAQQSDALAAIGAGDRILVAGDNVGAELFGNQFYFPVTHVDAQPACAADEFLDVTGACGAPNLPGTCKAIPQLCYQIYKPVCGCDGVTYSNDCVRLHAQVQLAHDGACATP